MSDLKIHQEQAVERRGAPLDKAKAAVILIHGRGGGVESILPLVNHLDVSDIAYYAPAAKGRTWYPQRFLAPRHNNEPYLSSAIAAIGDIFHELQGAGIPIEKTVLLGFSQGACLALEYAARNPKRYGGVIAFSGGLIGAEDELVGYSGSLQDTPIFIGCSDMDDHIPVERVHESAVILEGIGARVDARIYPNMGHTINNDEMQAAQAILKALV